MLRNTLEIIYFLSGPVIVIIAGIGLRQLKIAKENAKISAKRDAYRIAAEQCNFYMKNIIKLQNEFNKTIEEDNITFFKNSKIRVEGEQITISYREIEKAISEIQKLGGLSTAIYNSMESFALYFISGVADESIGFSSVGTTFCDSVKYYLPELMLLGSGKKHYKNLIKLFFLWNKRLEKEDLLRTKEKLEAKINKISDKTILPLGANSKI